MCTNPIRILNNSRFIKPNGGQKLYTYVPCGHCLDCRRHHQNEWRIRTYFHALDTIQNNGYVLFDTLTYSNLYLPHLRDFVDVPKELDFPCFSSLDLQLFKKRLRSNLKRSGYDPKDVLDMFFVSEFGTDYRYSHRPHYHVFFFVRDSFVDPVTLSLAVSKAWSHCDGFDNFAPIGRTDGVLYRGSNYVLNHNVFKDIESSKKCLMYVSKYVSKDFQYSDLARNRLFKLMDYYYPGFDWSISKSMRKTFDMLSSYIQPFHRQSYNYGSYIIDYYGLENLLRDGSFVFSVNGLPMRFSLFPSLKRKLFYNHSRSVTGQVVWKLNYYGQKYRLHHAFDEVERLRQRIVNYNLNHSDKLTFSPFDFVFNHDVLRNCRIGADDVYSLVKSQFLIDSKNGYRNYFSVNYDYLKEMFVSKLDYGDKSSKFFYPGKPICLSTSLASDNVRLSALPVLHDSTMDTQYYRLVSWESSLGQGKLKFDRMVEKTKNKLKFLCLI